MDYKKRCLRETKKFLKNTFDTMYSAFCMGFDDGAKGERQTFPELPDPDEGLSYSSALFVENMYNRGYEAGRRGVSNEPVRFVLQDHD